MNLTQITNAVNAYTDENFSTNMVRYFVNEALSKINSELKTNLPLFEENTQPTISYVALSDSWINNLLVPYACYSVKMNDGSLSEAMIYDSKFNQNFEMLRENKYTAIGENYRTGEFDGIYKTDPTKGVNIGWFRR